MDKRAELQRQIRLQSILFPNENVCTEEALYFHRSADEAGRIDFDGYFNLFALDKWRKYSRIGNLYLHLKLRGYKELVLFCRREEIGRISLGECRMSEDGSGDTEADIAFPYADPAYGQVFWFALTEEEAAAETDDDGDAAVTGTEDTEKTAENAADGRVGKAIGNKERNAAATHISEGYFYTLMDAEAVRNVNIAVDICTFKREKYLERNIRQLKRDILFNDALEVSDRISIYIIDNGKTLKADPEMQELLDSCGGKVQVFENKNAGGTGGFTRGMMEALKHNGQVEGKAYAEAPAVSCTGADICDADEDVDVTACAYTDARTG